MTHAEAWHAIFRLWHCSEWTPIPDSIRAVLRLDSRLGMYRGSLVSKAGAAGLAEFINRINSKGVL